MNNVNRTEQNKRFCIALCICKQRACGGEREGAYDYNKAANPEDRSLLFSLCIAKTVPACSIKFAYPINRACPINNAYPINLSYPINLGSLINFTYPINIAYPINFSYPINLLYLIINFTYPINFAYLISSYPINLPYSNIILAT